MKAERRGFHGRDSLVVRTSRCGRDNPGSNPGHGIFFMCIYIYIYIYFFFFIFFLTCAITTHVNIDGNDFF